MAGSGALNLEMRATVLNMQLFIRKEAHLRPGVTPGGALGYFLGGYVLKKIPLKLIPRSRIRPKNHTPF